MSSKQLKAAKRKALIEHKRRMAKHARREIKINSSTIEEALNIPARKLREAKATHPLSHRFNVVAVSASVADTAKKSTTTQPKLPRSVKLKKSLKFTKSPNVREISPPVAADPQIANKTSKKSVRHRIPPYDGQPRFEGGFRIVQAGSFERGKRQ